MANMRIVYNNAADRGVITATSAVATLPASNLQTSKKSAVWRSVGKSATVDVAFPNGKESVGCVAIPFTNLSPTATARVRGTDEVTKLNKFTWTDNLSSSVWQISSVTILPYATTAPEGNTLAFKLRENVGPSSLFEFYRSFTPGTGQRQTVSIFAKAGERTKIRLSQVQSAFTLGASAFFDLVNGTVSSVTHFGGATGGVASIKSAGNGWYRCAIEVTPTTSSAWFIAVDLVTGTNTLAYTGDGVSGVYIAHAQCEAGSLTSYYPATVSFTSRASIGTFFGNNGLLQTAAVNVARMQYNPVNLAAPPYLLIENAATNLALQSGDISNAAWSTRWGGAATVATDPTVLAPDGTPAYKVTSTSGGSGVGQGVALTAGITYTFSMWVAAGASTRALGVWSSSGGGTTLASSTVPANLPMARYSVTYTAVTTSTHYFGLQNLPLGSSLWCAFGQLQVGVYADSYIPTTTATVTRAVDIGVSDVATRPLGYMDSWQEYAYDSSVMYPCSGQLPGVGVNSFGYGGSSSLVIWIPNKQLYGVQLAIADTDNTSDYIEASRVVVGNYWSPVYNTEMGSTEQSVEDRTKHYRTDSGDLLSDVGTRSKKVSVSLGHLTPDDRRELFNLMRKWGTANPILISVYPENADKTLEADFQVYGKQDSFSAISAVYYSTYANKLDVIEV